MKISSNIRNIPVYPAALDADTSGARKIHNIQKKDTFQKIQKYDSEHSDPMNITERRFSCLSGFSAVTMRTSVSHWIKNPLE